MGRSGVLLIIDGNNLAWAGYYALERAMKPEDDERRGRVAMLGLAAGILGAIGRDGRPPGSDEQVRITRAVVAFDEGRPLRRRSMFAPYQTGRERDPKFVANEPTILRAIDEFIVAARVMPFEIVRGKNTEADDLIAGTVQANKRARKRIVSTDRDFLQLIDATTSVLSPVKKLVIDASNFAEAVTPAGANAIPRDRYLDYRALVGDPSDDLPGVPGIGPLSAAKLVERAPLASYFGDAAAVRAALGRKSERVETAFADGAAAEVVARNRALMDLRLPAPCWDELESLTVRGAWDPAAFEAWLGEQRFGSLDAAAVTARMETLAAGRG
jgi:DNA polymerase-1